jgi:tetratricopeptide (TPR) repeat protein
MAYVFAEGGYGAAATVIHTNPSHPDVISISDAELLRSGTFHRAGADLHLKGHGGHHVVIPRYFASEHPAALVGPDGGRLNGDLVAQIAGHEQLAAAQPATANDASTHFDRGVIGHVDKVTGDVTVERSGVNVTLHAGDAVYKSDVIQCELLGRFDEALAWFDRTLELRPSSIAVRQDKASVLRRMHRFEEALAIHERVRSIAPDDAKAEFDLANLNLLLGNFAVGWRQREARWRVPGLPIHFPTAAEPVWLGEPSIEGKTILLYSDEGLGDAIQFARYVPLLAACGGRVILVVQDALQPLLSTLPGLTLCLPRSTAALPSADFRCPLTSLPLAFGTALDTVPPPARLFAPIERINAWEKRLDPRDRLRVGLTWSGSLMHPNDKSRSIPLASLTGLLEMDANFISLQKDPRPADKDALERSGIVDLTAQLTDFTETAALVSCVDVVITVDTSMAHLAPTLGCPTWILLPHTPDYRWLLSRDDSPWYPAVRLFRQDASRDYAGAIERVSAGLSAAVEIWKTARAT